MCDASRLKEGSKYVKESMALFEAVESTSLGEVYRQLRPLLTKWLEQARDAESPVEAVALRLAVAHTIELLVMGEELTDPVEVFVGVDEDAASDEDKPVSRVRPKLR